MTALLENAKLHPEVLELFHFDAERFDRLVAQGFITPDDRVELLDGQIVRKPDVNPPHLYRVKDIYDRVLAQFRGMAIAICQSTIVLPQDGRPDPDIALLRLETPRTRLPLPEDIHLVIEVSDTTLARDRDVKLALYARDGIKEYWIVNLEQNSLEVYREPDGDRYGLSFTVRDGRATACLDFPEHPIDWS
jgi:Uma2 family endonuclease